MKPKTPPDLVVEVESGDRRRGLEALRKRLASELAGGELLPRDVAALAGRLQAVLAELASLPTPREGTPFDELEKRRAARAGRRGSGADVPAGVSAGGRSRRR